MYFSLKSYQAVKVKKYFKNKSLFMVFHCSKLNLKEWVYIEQKLQKFNLNYYKPLNRVILKELKNSMYSNYGFLINNSVLFVSSNDELSPINFQNIQKLLKPLFLLIVVKLNNNLYSLKQFSTLKQFAHEQNVFLLHQVFNKSCKTSYVLSQ